MMMEDEWLPTQAVADVVAAPPDMCHGVRLVFEGPKGEPLGAVDAGPQATLKMIASHLSEEMPQFSKPQTWYALEPSRCLGSIKNELGLNGKVRCSSLCINSARKTWTQRILVVDGESSKGVLVVVLNDYISATLRVDARSSMAETVAAYCALAWAGLVAPRHVSCERRLIGSTFEEDVEGAHVVLAAKVMTTTDPAAAGRHVASFRTRPPEAIIPGYSRIRSNDRDWLVGAVGLDILVRLNATANMEEEEEEEEKEPAPPPREPRLEAARDVLRLEDVAPNLAELGATFAWAHALSRQSSADIDASLAERWRRGVVGLTTVFVNAIEARDADAFSAMLLAMVGLSYWSHLPLFDDCLAMNYKLAIALGTAGDDGFISRLDGAYRLKTQIWDLVRLVQPAVSRFAEDMYTREIIRFGLLKLPSPIVQFPDRPVDTAPLLDGMVSAAQTWTSSSSSSSSSSRAGRSGADAPAPPALRRLLSHLKVMRAATQPSDRAYGVTLEDLYLRYSVHEREYRWLVQWVRIDNQRAFVGRFSCPPFVEDPHRDAANLFVLRHAWDLKFICGLAETAAAWCDEAKVVLRPDDACRAVCAALLHVLKHSPDNTGTWICAAVETQIRDHFNRILDDFPAPPQKPQRPRKRGPPLPTGLTSDTSCRPPPPTSSNTP